MKDRAARRDHRVCIRNSTLATSRFCAGLPLSAQVMAGFKNPASVEAGHGRSRNSSINRPPSADHAGQRDDAGRVSEPEDDHPLLAQARRAVEVTIEALTVYRRALEAEPAAADEPPKIVQALGLLTTALVDELTRLYVGDGRDSEDLLDEAEAVVASLGATPAGFATSIDPQYYARMKRATAIMLARLWATGRLMGPVPIEAWPSAELARLLLPAVEHHADAISLEDELDRLDDDND
jgi:hypothetical protein